jgi:hypothetical protein
MPMRRTPPVKSFDWTAFLRQYNAELLPSEHVAEMVCHLDEDGNLAAAVQAGWLGYPGATEEQLARTEERLGVSLPPSYSAFLATSNGWRCPSTSIPRLWAAEEIERLAVTDPDAIDGWSEHTEPVGNADYFVYGDQQQPHNFSPDYLKRALQISEQEIAGSAVYLLVPDVVTPEGEWEAWMLAHWLPGAKRYRSFKELMEDERQSFLHSEAHAAKRMHPADTLDQLPAKLPNLIDVLLQQAETYRNIERPQPGVEGATAGATAAGLEEAVDNLRQVQAQNLRPEALLVSLLTLQQDMKKKHLEAQTHYRGPRIVFGFLRMKGAIETMARAEGYRQAAGQIEWFIKEAGGKA